MDLPLKLKKKLVLGCSDLINRLLELLRLLLDIFAFDKIWNKALHFFLICLQKNKFALLLQ